MEHRASERGFYERLQATEKLAARELLEKLLSDTGNTYEQICVACNTSPLFAEIKNVTPQDLSRYRQRKTRAESRATVMRLIEEEGATLLNAAAEHPSGAIATYLRKRLTEEAITRFDAGMEDLDTIEVSREAARHASVEQKDRKLDLDQEKIELERKRIDLAERQAELQKDKFKVAADTWQFTLGWFAREDARIADALTRASAKLLTDLEVYIEVHG